MISRALDPASFLPPPVTRRVSPTLILTMSSQDAFALTQLSEIFKLQTRIEHQLSTMARETCRSTFMFHREPYDDNEVDLFPKRNLDAGARIYPLSPRIPRPCSLLSPRSMESRRLQELGPVADIFEIFGEDFPSSLQSSSRYSIAWSPSLGYAMDVDYRTASSIFGVWRDMFSAGGSLATFSAICDRNGLAYRITHHPVSAESIPELSMILNVEASPSCCQRFFCSFNQNWFQPERFSLEKVNEQLVQLINAKLRRAGQKENPNSMEQLAYNPNKRPALEK